MKSNWTICAADETTAARSNLCATQPVLPVTTKQVIVAETLIMSSNIIILIIKLTVKRSFYLFIFFFIESHNGIPASYFWPQNSAGTKSASPASLNKQKDFSTGCWIITENKLIDKQKVKDRSKKLMLTNYNVVTWLQHHYH